MAVARGVQDKALIDGLKEWEWFEWAVGRAMHVGVGQLSAVCFELSGVYLEHGGHCRCDGGHELGAGQRLSFGFCLVFFFFCLFD